MERRAFLKVALGIVAGAAVMSSAAQAAPLSLPQTRPSGPDTPNKLQPQPALATPDDIEAARVEQVRWGRRRGWGRRRRFFGFRRRRFWRRRHWRRRFYW